MTIRRVLITTSLFLTLAGASMAHAGPRAYALAGQTLLPFDLAVPGDVGTPIPITGLIAGDVLVGIDFRPMNGHLYGLALVSGGGAVRLYHISFRNGVAATIGPSGTFVASNGTTPVPVRGTRFAVDFDSARDRLRVMDDAGESFLIDPNNGAYVDGDPNAPGINMDAAVPAPAVDALAFTNNRQNTLQTTAYAVSAANDAITVRQAGSIAATAYTIPLLLEGHRLDVHGAIRDGRRRALHGGV